MDPLKNFILFEKYLYIWNFLYICEIINRTFYTYDYSDTKKLFALCIELASKLEDAPWPATKDELIDYAVRSGAPLEVLENLQEIEDEGEIYESIEDIWPDYPSKDDFFFNEEEY